MMTNNNEIKNTKLILPIILILWIPMTIGLFLSLFYHIRWDYFGITEGINPFYLDRFESSLDTYLWIASNMGIIEISLFVLLSIGYLWLCKQVYNGIFH